MAALLPPGMVDRPFTRSGPRSPSTGLPSSMKDPEASTVMGAKELPSGMAAKALKRSAIWNDTESRGSVTASDIVDENFSLLVTHCSLEVRGKKVASGRSLSCSC